MIEQIYNDLVDRKVLIDDKYKGKVNYQFNIEIIENIIDVALSIKRIFKDMLPYDDTATLKVQVVEDKIKVNYLYNNVFDIEYDKEEILFANFNEYQLWLSEVI